MCGITGWIDWRRDLTQAQDIVGAMIATLACRGPDGSGLWLSRHAALGHRRLIVVDPKGGGQPMTCRRSVDDFVITYNGELYNTEELRRELEGCGQVFASRSDTEVLLRSFIEWGPDCLDRLNGIFAFAIWSEADQRLFLARDRLGVKPLFYARRGDALFFASELKALLAHPAVQPEIDREGLAEVLVLGPGRTPGHGVFRGVHELKPGHCLVYDQEGLRSRCYWRLESRPHGDDLEETAATVKQLLQDAVERQLVSDVPVCALLSGGLDSSALAAFASAALARSCGARLRTFSVDYAGNAANFEANEFQPTSDAAWVTRVSEFLDTRHTQATIDTPSLAAALTEAMRARDLPGMADIDSSLYLFCRSVKREATVALSGECADEVFGGYPWFTRREDVTADTFPWTRRMERRLELLSAEVRQWIRPEEYVAERYREALAGVPRLAGEDANETRMRELSHLTLFHWMPVLLDRKDRMSMAVGLEVRVPFCDHRLVEYAWNIPWSLKSWGGQAKGILRRALVGTLPADVLSRRKSPYPKTHDPAYLAAVRGQLRHILADPSSPLLSLIDMPAVKALASGDAAEFDVPWFGQLSRLPQLIAYLVQVDTWLREYRVVIR